MKLLHNTPDEPATARASLDRLFELAEVLGSLMQRGLAERGLTTARAGVLWELFHHGPMTQRALAARRGVTPRNVTGLLDALEEEGLVTRGAHPTDRRATLVSLSAKGRTFTSDLRGGRDELAAVLFGDLPPGQMAAFTDTLTVAIDRLKGVEPGGEAPGTGES
ncbi:MarR family transcriptional regulator [Streptomyces sp. TRM66268-LWL]|uniref:MarR family transcriptional regulator n=1 Tax=Streptomyces polyasparticus TaxID=2767826 RepID=A0ABR7SJ27_9ACTN|nr:MarR family transcriptional regulator [Streptomyces polyasparticus]MBC9714700.1 MarR family transcriptional regulator [Streptomyces polyasparticus]